MALKSHSDARENKRKNDFIDKQMTSLANTPSKSKPISIAEVSV